MAIGPGLSPKKLHPCDLHPMKVRTDPSSCEKNASILGSCDSSESKMFGKGFLYSIGFMKSSRFTPSTVEAPYFQANCLVGDLLIPA